LKSFAEGELQRRLFLIECLFNVSFISPHFMEMAAAFHIQHEYLRRDPFQLLDG